MDDYLKVRGSANIFALGDASATKFAPTAQVASNQGKYLAKFFNNFDGAEYDVDAVAESLGPYTYEHLGSLAYVFYLI